MAQLTKRSLTQLRLIASPTALAVAAAGLFTGLYLFTAWPRLLYPYDLDFIENGMLMQAWQHAQGLPVFVPPNADFAPNVYMPLYTWLGGLLLTLTGPSYIALRLLSFTATLTTAGLISWITHRESGRAWLALACAGLYLGGVRITGFWYELARVDALYVALTLAGWTAGVYSGGTRRGAAASAALLALAFFTKQTAVLFAGALCAALLARHGGRRAGLWAGLFAALTALPYWLFDRLTGGWFTFHTFALATANPVESGRVLRYFGAELLGVMAVLSLLMCAAALWTWRGHGTRRLAAAQPWLLGAAAAVVVSGLGRAPVGGNLNNLMPVYAFLCLAPALLARGWLGAPAAAPRWATGALAFAILAQFALGAYNPLRYIPTPEMRAAGDRLIARLRAVDGEVLVLMHPYYAVLAGKSPSAQIIHFWYFYKDRGLPLPADFVERIETQHYAVIVSDESLFETEPAFRSLIDAHYQPAERLSEADSPPTTTGLTARPQLILTPRLRPALALERRAGGLRAGGLRAARSPARLRASPLRRASARLSSPASSSSSKSP